MKRTILKAVLPIAMYLMVPASAAFADSISFVATLTGTSESPATGSPATGSAFVVIDTVANTMQINVTFAGLEGGSTASHIHCCLASPFLVGSNVGVATTLPTFADFPLGVTSGTYSRLFDLTLASTYNPAFDGGTVGSQEATLVAGLKAGETYLNIHTNPFPGGEIRGFLVPAPEPSSLLLLGSGLLGLFGMRRRRIQNT